MTIKILPTALLYFLNLAFADISILYSQKNPPYRGVTDYYFSSLPSAIASANSILVCLL